ncbi:MAG: TSUP family transporter [Lentisphaeria bacterium]|nr:TSUP family transporter [Lentisphaeria bacterium]NQZ69997.1 TSUP family transporter [Lentisphaeria bacterium]
MNLILGQDMLLWQALLIILIIFVAHLLGGISAFGSALLSLPLILLVKPDLDWAVFILVSIGLIQSIQIFYYSHKDFDKKQFTRIAIYMSIGLIIGFAGLVFLSKLVVMICLSLILFAAGTFALCKPEGLLKMPNPIKIILLLLSGMAHGAFGCGGAALTVYAKSVFETKEAFRATLSFVWIWSNLITIPIFYFRIAGKETDHRFGLIIICTVVVILASILSQVLSKKLKQKQFFKFTSVLLILCGVVNTINLLRG